MKSILWFLAGAAVLLVLSESCRKKDIGKDTGGEEEPKEYTLPTPKLSISNPFPCVGEEIELSFESETALDGHWRFGDGHDSSGKTVTRTFSQNGNYSLTLSLSDGKGGSVMVDTIISVMGQRLTDALVDLLNTPARKWICAHRGFTYSGKKIGRIPENSIEAIIKASEVGAELVEVDVRTTADGIPVLMHDETIDRTTDGAGMVKDISLATLKRLFLKDDGGRMTSSRVPTLEEALVAGRGKVYFDLDLKDIDPETVVKIVESTHMLDRVAFIAEVVPLGAKEITDVNSKAIIFPYVNRASAIASWSANPRIKMIQLDYNSSETAGPIVEEARSNGIASFANFLNAPGEAVLSGDYAALDRIIDLQFHIIQTDYAEFVRAYLTK